MFGMHVLLELESLNDDAAAGTDTSLPVLGHRLPTKVAVVLGTMSLLGRITTKFSELSCYF